MRIPNLMLTDSCQVKRYKGASALGPQYLDSTPYEVPKCRFEPKRKQIILPSGEEFLTSGIFYLPPDANNKTIKPQSIMYFNGEEMKAQVIDIMRGFIDSHVVVYV